MDKDELITRLAAAYLRQGQMVHIENLRLLTGGSAAQTWSFETRQSGISAKYILRLAHEGEAFALGLDKAAEAQVQNLAATNGVISAPIDLLLQAGDGLGDGFVMPFIEGESIPQRILRKNEFSNARNNLGGQCGRELALLHAIDPAKADLLPHLSASKQLEALGNYYSESGQIIPIFDYAFRWLENHQPTECTPTIVHGDFRNGNLLVDNDGLTCVMDWELSHIGDPMEDLGWLCVPSWRFGVLDKPVGGFGTREALFEAYESAGGERVDPQRVRYWEIFGVLKWGIICLYQFDVHFRGVDKSINRAAIGRRVSETELDLFVLLKERLADAH